MKKKTSTQLMDRVEGRQSVYVVIPRPLGSVEILIFREGSEDLNRFLTAMEQEGRGYQIADTVNLIEEYVAPMSGVRKVRKYTKRKKRK